MMASSVAFRAESSTARGCSSRTISASACQATHLSAQAFEQARTGKAMPDLLHGGRRHGSAKSSHVPVLEHARFGSHLGHRRQLQHRTLDRRAHVLNPANTFSVNHKQSHTSVWYTVSIWVLSCPTNATAVKHPTSPGRVQNLSSSASGPCARLMFGMDLNMSILRLALSTFGPCAAIALWCNTSILAALLGQGRPRLVPSGAEQWY